MNDILMVGGGIAGITAAIYAKRAGFSPIILESDFLGGQILSSCDVENYPALPGSSGAEIAESLKKQMESMNITHIFSKTLSIESCENFKAITTTSGKIEAKAVIIASGCKPKKLGCTGEDEFWGKGVSRCALCDGNFFAGKKAAVIGGGNSAAEEAIYLSKICIEVFLIHRRRDFRAEKSLMETVFHTENIKIVTPFSVCRISGEENVSAIEIENTETKDRKSLTLDGVFTAVGQTPNTEFCADIIKLSDTGFIKSDEHCRTNVTGIFAAGDCREKNLRQLVTAAADGAVAASAAVKFLENL